MTNRIIAIIFIFVLFGCGARRPDEVRQQAQDRMDAARRVDSSHASLREAEQFYEMGLEAERQREFAMAVRWYRDAWMSASKVTGGGMISSDQSSSYIEPQEYRNLPPPAPPLPPPVPALTSPSTPTTPLPLPLAPIKQTKPKKLQQAERHFPEPRKIEDLKKEGIADLSKKRPVPSEKLGKKVAETADEDDLKLLFKEKFPGVVSYAFGEAEFQSSSLPTLMKLASKLKDDPQAKVMFLPQLGQGERYQLTDERFDRLQALLLAKGIPESQISFDEKRLVGEWPEIRIFILH